MSDELYDHETIVALRLVFQGWGIPADEIPSSFFRMDAVIRDWTHNLMGDCQIHSWGGLRRRYFSIIAPSRIFLCGVVVNSVVTSMGESKNEIRSYPPLIEKVEKMPPGYKRLIKEVRDADKANRTMA